MNILIFPGSTEIAMELHRALRYLKGINLFACGSSVWGHGHYVWKYYMYVSSIASSHWVNDIRKVIDRYNISFIYPAHDAVMIPLLEYISTDMIISPPLDTVKITRSKRATYELFNSTIHVPKVYDVSPHSDFFPLFSKPDIGQGSQGTKFIANLHDLRTIDFIDNVVMEYLPGVEYTVDCFTDRHGKLLYCGPRKRNMIRSGISVSASVDFDNISFFEGVAKAIMDKLEMRGGWFFQMKADKHNTLKLLEIAPRIAGTSALSRCMGVNLPELTLYDHQNIDVKIDVGKNVDNIDRALINRYKCSVTYDSVFVDLDDTLIINGKVNTDLIKFLYQCKNNDIDIFLISKNQMMLHKLHRYNIPQQLFSDMFIVMPDESKVDYISISKSKFNPILIDDSFRERDLVASVCDIPVFDCSMIEALIDDRV